LARREHGENHMEFATAIAWLGFVYKAEGHYAEAEPLYKRSLAIAEKALGPDHPDVGINLNNLAALYFVQRDWVRAADFWRRSTRVTQDVGQALTRKSPVDLF
jgi:tetratricopeptide (TPR) repeat protein